MPSSKNTVQVSIPKTLGIPLQQISKEYKLKASSVNTRILEKVTQGKPVGTINQVCIELSNERLSAHRASTAFFNKKRRYLEWLQDHGILKKVHGKWVEGGEPNFLQEQLDGVLNITK